MRSAADGAYVEGRWDAATGQWKSRGVLAYDTVYRVTATVTGAVAPARADDDGLPHAGPDEPR